jgi:hypothetical protein
LFCLTIHLLGLALNLFVEFRAMLWFRFQCHTDTIVDRKECCCGNVALWVTSVGGAVATIQRSISFGSMWAGVVSIVFPK